MANTLLDPPFAANPPVKLNVNAKILGLVLGILALIAALFVGLIGGLLSIFSLAAGGFGGLWLIGTLIALVGYIMSTIAGFQMYGGNRAGKNLMIYGLLVLFAGAVVGAIGRIVAYSGIIGFGAGYALGGAIVGLILDVIIYGILYYLVVVSRFPGDVPLVASPGGYGNPPGGYGSPPPPPPPSV
jgi:hypothetical protein